MAALVILAIAAPFVAWGAVERVLLILSSARIQTGFSERRAAKLLSDLGAASKELEALGFRSLGARFERIWRLGLRRWELCYASDADRCFAGLNAKGVYLITLLSDGVLVMTSTRAALSSRGLASPGLDHLFARGASASELLRMHRERVSKRVGPGRDLPADLSPAARVAVCEAFYRAPKVARRRMLMAGLSLAAYAYFVGAFGWLALVTWR